MLLEVASVHVGDCAVPASKTARNLGAVFDEHMILKPHISSLVKSCKWPHQTISHRRGCRKDHTRIRQFKT